MLSVISIYFLPVMTGTVLSGPWWLAPWLTQF